MTVTVTSQKNVEMTSQKNPVKMATVNCHWPKIVEMAIYSQLSLAKKTFKMAIYSQSND